MLLNKQKMKSPLKITWLLSAVLANTTYAASTSLYYSNTDFNISPSWSNTLTIHNPTDSAITIKQLIFETNYNQLDTSQLYGSIYHPQRAAIPTKLGPYDYQYAFSTESPNHPGQYTIVPAHGSVNLTQIPIAHTQESSNGAPLYYRLPFNVKVALSDNNIVPLSMVNSCHGESCNNPTPQYLSGSYFTDWANYHSSPDNVLMPKDIPINKMNTIFYAIGKIDRTTASVYFVDINHDQYYLPAFDTLKQQYPYLNLIYSFGGWGDAGSNSYPSYDLAYIFDQADSSLIEKLAENMVNTMLTLGFNGIDIDYEWTAVQPGTAEGMKLTPTRAKGYQQLLTAIRQRLNNLQPATDNHYYKLTTAVFSGVDKIDDFIKNGGSWSQINAAVDYLNLMTYDMHGQFDLSWPAPDNITDFHSGMRTDHHYQSSILNQYNVTDAVNAYVAQGIETNKMVLGLPAYTRIEKTIDAITEENKGLYLTLSNDQPGGESGSGGTTDYKCIINNQYCWGGFNFNRNTLMQVPANFSQSGIGAGASTPWAYDKSKQWFMSYDNGASAAYKANWVKQHGMGGVMVWEIDGDVPKTDANFTRDSIIYNLWNGLQ